MNTRFPPPIFHLELFGSPTVRGAGGAPLSGRATQRHRLALLAFLALSGGRGSTRDRLMALLWPDSDQDRARNLLKVSVYVLRQALGDDALVSDGDDLRVNPERIETDVAEFEGALARGDYEGAVALYHGAFLDGFFVSRAPDFERWVDRERKRLAGSYANALEVLADAAERRRELREAVEWWKVRAAQDPYDSRVALRLMRALETGGNPAGALQHAAIHERLLQEELGIEPAPEVRAMAARLRMAPASSVALGGHIESRPADPRIGARASEPVANHLAPPFRLQALGGLVLRGPHGPVTTGDVRRDELPLLLLAVLAASGDQGLGRDELLLLFWPETSQHAARQSLDQVLETIRTLVHEHSVAGTDPLKLDPAVITSDVRELEHALNRGQLDEAIERYRGPFLDRVHLGDSRELAHWVKARRASFAARRDAALEGLPRATNHHAGTAAATPERVTAGQWTRWWRHTLWFGVAALTIGAVIASWPGPSTPARGVPRIAVLPLRNISTDPDYTALADGMTEELISLLGREPDKLRVIPSSSVWRFRDRQTDWHAVAEGLSVGYILEGSLQKVDTSLQKVQARVRLIVKLVDARDGSVVWTRPYERQYASVLGEPANVARSVAEALGVHLTSTAGTGQLPTATPGGAVSSRRVTAIDLVNDGKRDVLSRSESGRRWAVDLFSRAIEADSTYAPAHAELSHFLLLTADDSGGSYRERLAQAKRSAHEAIRLDSSLAIAHAALGHVLLNEYHLDEAEEHLKTAITLDPTQPAFRDFLVWLYIAQGRTREALEQAKHGASDNPYSPTAIAEVARALLANGRCGEALEQLRQLKQLQPPPARAGEIGAQCYAQQHKWQEAIDEMRPVAERNPVLADPWLGFMLARAGRAEEANRIRDSVLARQRRGTNGAFELAMIHAGFGRFDEAIELLLQSIDDRSLRLSIMEPVFHELHEHPRFARVREKLGLQKR